MNRFILQLASAALQQSRRAPLHYQAFPHSLIWTPPSCQADSHVMRSRVSAAVLYPALSCKPEPAGPDGIRQERPHLSHALWGARLCSGLRSCGPTCLAITLNQPQQPTSSTSMRRAMPASRSRGLVDKPDRVQGSPMPFAPSCLQQPPLQRWWAGGPESLSATALAP